LKLNNKNILTLGTGYHRDDHSRGLVLRVYESGERSWLFRYSFMGKDDQKVTLGPLESIPLDTEDGIVGARELAFNLRNGLAKGIDPKMTLGRTAASDLTVNDLCRDLLDPEKLAITKKTRDDWRGYFKNDIEPGIGNIAATLLTRHQIRDWGEKIAKRTGYGANRAFEFLRRAYSFATEREKLQATPFFPKIKKPFQGERGRTRVLSTEELSYIMTAVAMPDTRTIAARRIAAGVAKPRPSGFAQGIELMLLSLMRKEAIAGAQAKEFDLGENLWTLPAEREGLKNYGKDICVPLSAAILDLLGRISARGGKGGFLFPPGAGVRNAASKTAHARFGTKPLREFQKVVNELAGRELKPWSYHTFRHTGMSWLVENEFADVAGMCLAHVPKDLSAADLIYTHTRRLKRILAALDAWGEFLKGGLRAELAQKRKSSSLFHLPDSKPVSALKRAPLRLVKSA
jgi:integrase